MRRLIVIAALLAAACGSKSKQPSGDTEEPTGEEEEGGGDGPNLADVAPELDELNTEINSIRDLPSEERDVEACEMGKGLGRMIEDLTGAAPAGVDPATWDAGIDQMSESLDDLEGACPDKVDELDAAFTGILDALDALVETTQLNATGPAAE